MARPDFPLSAALSAVHKGMSARAGLAAFRAGGGRVGDAKWFRTVAEVRRTVAESIVEATRPLNRRPSGDEITTVTSVRHSGYWQQVEIFLRDKSTGEVRTMPFVHRSSGLVTRQAAIGFAVDEAKAGSAGSINLDDEEVLGAAYVSTLELIPRE